MGAINSVLTGVNALTTAIGTINAAANTLGNLGSDPQEEQRRQLMAQQNVALQQLQQKQQLDSASREQQAALERERMAVDTAAAEQERMAALRRAVARQKASFGAQGIGSDGGSSEAVLLGLFEESDEERQERERIDDVRGRMIDEDMAAQDRINVLQRSQLEERQEIERLASGY
jgi:hypothetical protein